MRVTVYTALRVVVNVMFINNILLKGNLLLFFVKMVTSGPCQRCICKFLSFQMRFKTFYFLVNHFKYHQSPLEAYVHTKSDHLNNNCSVIINN